MYQTETASSYLAVFSDANHIVKLAQKLSQLSALTEKGNYQQHRLDLQMQT